MSRRMSQQPHPGHRLTRTERTSPHGTPQNVVRTPTGGQNAVPASDGWHSGPHRSEGRHLRPRESTSKTFRSEREAGRRSCVSSHVASGDQASSQRPPGAAGRRFERASPVVSDRTRFVKLRPHSLWSAFGTLGSRAHRLSHLSPTRTPQETQTTPGLTGHPRHGADQLALG